VAKAVIDLLEIVGVNDQQRAAIGGIAGVALFQIVQHAGGEGAAIEAGGQPVGARQPFEPGIGVAQLFMLEGEIKHHRPAQSHRHQHRHQDAGQVEAGGKCLHENMG
jgi:hypothetical protein